MEQLIFHKIDANEVRVNESEIILKPWINEEKSLTLESVCGVDQRVKVVATNQLPYMAICKLYLLAANGGTYVGTGWLVSKDKLYTAGHCVFNHDADGWKEDIVVVPAKSGFSEPYGRYKATAVAATKGWVENRSPRYDMGAIKLNKAVEFDGFLQPTIEDSNDGTVCGYPADRDNGLFQYERKDTLAKTLGMFEYFADTFGGQSGGPILKNRRQAIGIHNYGGCPNKASDLYQNFIDEVAAW